MPWLSSIKQAKLACDGGSRTSGYPLGRALGGEAQGELGGGAHVLSLDLGAGAPVYPPENSLSSTLRNCVLFCLHTVFQ